MNFNIRDYISDDHIESISEIATGQASLIQALSLDNSQKDKEIERLNKELKQEKIDFKEANDKCFELILENKRLNNIINKLEKWLVEWRGMLDYPDFYEEGIIDCINDTLIKLQELKGSAKE